jgi:hypothetical protein
MQPELSRGAEASVPRVARSEPRDALAYRELLRPVLEGRRFLIAGGPVTAARA